MPPLTVSRTLSIQLMDSFAQTELAERVIPEESADFTDGIIAKEIMIDSGVDQVQRSDQSSDDGRLRLVSVSDEDVAMVVDNNLASSQEVSIMCNESVMSANELVYFSVCVLILHLTFVLNNVPHSK